MLFPFMRTCVNWCIQQTNHVAYRCSTFVQPPIDSIRFGQVGPHLTGTRLHITMATIISRVTPSLPLLPALS
jgi:hypothetical protein